MKHNYHYHPEVDYFPITAHPEGFNPLGSKQFANFAIYVISAMTIL